MTDEQKKVVLTITIKLAQLGYDVTFTDPITSGPMITTYRFMPKQAAKVSQICGLSADIAMALAAEDVIVRRLPGESVIGISVPNDTRSVVAWRDTLSDPDASNNIPLNLGVDQHGAKYRVDLTTMPHLLIAGSTGGGKSTLMSSMIASLAYWRDSRDVLLYLSDTKQVEFGLFESLPHVKRRVLTKYETWEVMDLLSQETDKRLEMFAAKQCRNLLDYNRARPTAKLAHLVLIIDELYDILGGEERGEAKVANIKLQTIVGRSRASGIHVIAATQRSSVDVVKGTAKSNFPARISFRLPSEADSRTILGQSGAEHLLARGDMWFLSPSHPALIRLHSAYATIDDIKFCVDYVKSKHQFNQQGAISNASQVTSRSN